MFQSLRTVLLTLALLGGLTDAALADRPHRDRYDNPRYSEDGRHRDRDRDDRGRGRGEDRQRERGMSMDQAVQMVQRRFNARVVRAESWQDGGRTVYRLRLLNSEGKVWTVEVDAVSGSIR